MAFFVSPGIEVREYEVASNTLTTSSSPVGFAGVFEWGPVGEVTIVDSKTTLKNVFGSPSEENATDWFTAANFLDYSSNLNLVRVINDEVAKNATVGGKRALNEAGITNEDFARYMNLSEDEQRNLQTVFEGAVEAVNAAQDAVDAALVEKNAKETALTTAQDALTAAVSAVSTKEKEISDLVAERTRIESLSPDDDEFSTKTKVETLAEIDEQLATKRGNGVGELQDLQAKKETAQTAFNTAKGEFDTATTNYESAKNELTKALTAKNVAEAANKVNTAIDNIKESLTLIKNNSDWTTKFSNGATNGILGEFAAKYPSDIGNNLAVYMADSRSYAAVTEVIPNVKSYIYKAKDNGTGVTFADSPFGDEYTAKGHIVLFDNDEEKESLATGKSKLVNGVSVDVPEDEWLYTIKRIELTDSGNYNKPGGRYMSPPRCTLPKPKDAKNSNGVPLTKVSLWKYATNFMNVPGTSNFAAQRGATNDEMHMVVVDETGVLTGTKGTVLESFANVSKASDAKYEDGTSSYYVNVLRDKSNYVCWLQHPAVGTNWGQKARGVQFTTLDPVPGSDVVGYYGALGGGFSGSAVVDVYNKLSGWDVFADAERTSISILMTGAATLAEQQYIIDICEARKDCIALISPLKSDVVDNTGKELNNIIATRSQLRDSTYAFMDSNWKYMYDMFNDVYRWVPCNSDIAGIMARTDDQYAAWWSPAGTNRGILQNVVRLAWNPSGTDRDVLYQNAVNPVCTFLADGTVLYGDKTMINRQNSPFQNINARRLLIVLEKTISNAAKSLLFEFNDATSRTRFVQIVEPFLETVKAGRGVTEYRLVCDETNNTPDIVAQNAFVGDIYVKPTKTINYIRLNFVCVASDVSFDEVVGNFG